MGWTKRQLILQAFEAIGLASHTFDLSAEQEQSALRQLDSMMATWNGRGLRLGYPIPSTAGGSRLAEDSEVPDRANEAIYLNLAIRLASGVGRQVSIELKESAKQAYDALLSRSAMPSEMQLPSGVPAGAGHKNSERPFLDPPEDNLLVGPDGELDLD